MRKCTRPHKLNTAVQRRVRAAQKDTEGRMLPAGRSLPTPSLSDTISDVLYNIVYRDMSWVLDISCG